MRKIYPKASHGLGNDGEESIFSKNHFAGLATYSPEVQSQITGWGMTRVAGNIWAVPAARDFWQVKGGHIIKLVGGEVNDGESIPATPETQPNSFISAMLSDLEF